MIEKSENRCQSLSLIQPEKTTSSASQLLLLSNPIKIEIGPGAFPRANLEPQTDWFLIEKYQLADTLSHLDDLHSIIGYSDCGFVETLPLLAPTSIDEILAVDLLTY